MWAKHASHSTTVFLFHPILLHILAPFSFLFIYNIFFSIYSFPSFLPPYVYFLLHSTDAILFTFSYYLNSAVLSLPLPTVCLIYLSSFSFTPVSLVVPFSYLLLFSLFLFQLSIFNSFFPCLRSSVSYPSFFSTFPESDDSSHLFVRIPCYFFLFLLIFFFSFLSAIPSFSYSSPNINAFFFSLFSILFLSCVHPFLSLPFPFRPYSDFPLITLPISSLPYLLLPFHSLPNCFSLLTSFPSLLFLFTCLPISVLPRLPSPPIVYPSLFFSHFYSLSFPLLPTLASFSPFPSTLYHYPILLLPPTLASILWKGFKLLLDCECPV